MINYELAKEIGATHYADNGDLYKVRGVTLLCYSSNEEWKESISAPWFIVEHIKPIPTIDTKHTKESTAVDTLERMGYEWTGGEWKKQKPVEYEYIKVTDSIFDLRPDFEAGELYVQLLGNSGEYAVIEEESTLIDEMNDDNVYRRTEKQADWLSEVMDKFSIQRNDRGLISMTYNDVGFAEPVFLEMCRVALRARGEL